MGGRCKVGRSEDPVKKSPVNLKAFRHTSGGLMKIGIYNISAMTYILIVSFSLMSAVGPACQPRVIALIYIVNNYRDRNMK